MANVIFKVGTLDQYIALESRNVNTLYWLTDVQRIYRGDTLFASGANATTEMAGLLSPEDKAKLDAITADGNSVDLSALDASIRISDGKIGVQLSAVDGNILELKGDGLFAAIPAIPVVPSYEIEKQDAASDGYAATYKLKCVSGEDVIYVGDEINIPKDMVLQSGSMQTAIMDGVPYEGAKVGDPYIDLVLSDANSTHIYVPVAGIVDVYVAGKGIEIVDGTVSVKINESNANGLFVDENGVGMNLATVEKAGAMSAVDKMVLASLPSVYEKIEYKIVHAPEGTIVDYRDKEIRIMCPADTEWHLQNVGKEGNDNLFYVALYAYAPNDNIVGFKEDLAETITDETMYDFNSDFSGIDEFGRKYSVVWLPVASYDENTDSWTYYGSMSGNSKYIGWHYSVDWYDASGVKVDADMIRINLSNEDCHNNIQPYYMNDYAETDEVEALKASISDLEATFSWGDM